MNKAKGSYYILNDEIIFFYDKYLLIVVQVFQVRNGTMSNIRPEVV